MHGVHVVSFLSTKDNRREDDVRVRFVEAGARRRTRTRFLVRLVLRNAHR